METDSLGNVKVPSWAYWGAQTQRSINNFKIGAPGSMPREVIMAFAYLKKAAALTNLDLVTGKRFTLIAFPLNFIELDASPCRAIALLNE